MTLYMINSILLLRQTGSFHPIVQMIFTVCILSCISSLFYMIHFFSLAFDGFGSTYIHGIAFLVNIGAKLTFLLSEGWTVSLDYLPNKFYSALVILLIANANLFGFIFCFYLNEETSFYFYDSPPGIFNLVLNICCAIIFGVSLYSSIERESNAETPKNSQVEEKINNLKFLWRLLPFYFVLPLLCIIVLALPVVYRNLTIIIVSNFTELFFYLLLCWSMHPTRISFFFKFSNRSKNLFDFGPTYETVDENNQL